MTNNNLTVVVDTALNPSSVKNLENQIQRHKYKVKVDLDNSNISNLINSLDVNLQKTFKNSRKYTTEISNDFQRISQQISNIQTWSGGNNTTKHLIDATKYTEQYKNALGDVIERISVFDSKNKLLETSERKIISATKEVNTETTKTKVNINGLDTTVKTMVKTFVDTDGNIKKIIQTTKEWIDDNGKLHTTIETTDEKGNQLKATIHNIAEEIKKLTGEEEKNNAENKKLGQTFSDIVGKVTKFYLASLPIRVVQTMITDATQAVKEFDSAFTELAKVSTLSGNALKQYANELADIGDGVARTKTEMVQTATELTKAGYSAQDTKILSELVALYQNTADEELSASEATSVLVSQLKAFNKEASDGIHITDAINKVSAEFAVSSGDIGRGLTQAGASLSTYGNSFDETIGLKLGQLKPTELLENP